MPRLLAVLLTALTLALPATAMAQDSPFAPLPTPAPQTNTDVTVPAGTLPEQNDSFGTTGYVLITLFALAVIGGIAYVILRDAREHAPGDDRPGLFAGRGSEPKGDPEEAAVAKRRADDRKRAAAKRARQARKKNRPR